MAPDPARHDPADQSGRPWLVSGAIGLIVVVLLILVVVGVLVLG
jgi:hypothetical protein